MRGDDAAGIEVATRLGRERAAPVAGDPLQAIDCWGACHHVVIVDAMRSGAEAGTIRRCSLDELGSVDTFASSHSVGPVELVGLARVLDRLPDVVEIVGIEAQSVEHGDRLSAPVQRAVELLVEELRYA